MNRAKKAPDPREDWESKPLAVQVRGSSKWKAWLERLAGFSRTTVSNAIDQGMADFARKVGFPEEPPKR